MFTTQMMSCLRQTARIKKMCVCVPLICQLDPLYQRYPLHLCPWEAPLTVHSLPLSFLTSFLHYWRAAWTHTHHLMNRDFFCSMGYLQLFSESSWMRITTIRMDLSMLSRSLFISIYIYWDNLGIFNLFCYISNSLLESAMMLHYYLFKTF